MSKPPRIEILVSTMEGKAFQNEKLFFSHPEVLFTVINQTSQPDHFAKQVLPNNCRLFNFNERGLSKSRNRALSSAIGEILVIADDDIFYSADFVEKLLQAYQQNQADSVIFQNIWNPRFFNSKWAEFFDLLKISSFEVSFRSSAVKNLYFDESFGLGARYNSGEENIFLVDLYKRNKRIFIISQQLVNHPNLGTGYIWDIRTAEAKGALCRRLFGIFGVFAFFAFTIKKYALFKNNLSGLSFLRAGLRSLFSYRQQV